MLLRKPPTKMRPLWLFFELLRLTTWPDPAAISATSIVETFKRLGIGEAATRSIIARLLEDDRLVRHRRGRQVYLAPSEVMSGILRYLESCRRLQLDEVWDGTWTLVAVSLPHPLRAQRNALQSRLIFAGFGRLQNGLWIAPREVDVKALLGDLETYENVRPFTGKVTPESKLEVVINEAFEIKQLAASYERFASRWSAKSFPIKDALAARVLLGTEWTILVGSDPVLPIAFLPADWPSLRARQAFLRADGELEQLAAGEVDEIIDTISLHSG
jgi:phenylacetic acid degradation operon negative regulatory protein